MHFKKLGLFSVALSGLLLAGCNNQDDSSATIEEKLNYTINGIEPGSGTMELANNALQDYENLNNWNLTERSTAGMLGELDKAYKNEEPIIFTGWNPHWMFAKYDLKYLEDPKKSLGEIENINTIVRKGFKEDLPNAYTIVDRFYWEPEDMETVMTDAQDSNFEDAANKWVEENSDTIAEWTAGVEKGKGTRRPRSTRASPTPRRGGGRSTPSSASTSRRCCSSMGERCRRRRRRRTSTASICTG